MKSQIKKFNQLGIKNVDIVGGKNASLGEMYNELTSKGVQFTMCLNAVYVKCMNHKNKKRRK